MAYLTQQLQLVAKDAKLPSSLQMDAEAWAEAIQTAELTDHIVDRRQRATAALRVKAVDPDTLAALLEDITFTSDDKQIAAGWMRWKGRGTVAKATAQCGDLVRLLVSAARPWLAGQACSTIVIRKGAAPQCHFLGGSTLATVHLAKETNAGGKRDRWHAHWSGRRAIAAGDYVIDFCRVGVKGASERKTSAELRKLGLGWECV